MPSAGTTVNGVPSQLTFLVPKDDSSRGERLLAGWGALFRALHPACQYHEIRICLPSAVALADTETFRKTRVRGKSGLRDD